MGIIAAPGPEFPLTADVLALADVRIDTMGEFTLEMVQETGRLRDLRWPG